jgi:hypothetical protein
MHVVHDDEKHVEEVFIVVGWPTTRVPQVFCIVTSYTLEEEANIICRRSLSCHWFVTSDAIVAPKGKVFHTRCHEYATEKRIKRQTFSLILVWKGESAVVLRHPEK